MSEEDAALFWELNPDPNSNTWRENMDLAPHIEKASPAENVGPGMVISTMPLSVSDPAEQL